MFIWCVSTNYTGKKNIEQQFNNISNDPSDIGGLLVHMLGVTDLENMMKKDKFDLSLMADCAAFNRHTCSAWTLIRRDLPPMVFIFPGKESPNVGIILNANKAWPLVTTMGNIDSNTNNRNCCQQENGAPQITRWPWQDTSGCISKMLLDKGFDITPNGDYSGYLVYIPTINHDGGECPLSCSHNDLFCKYNNAGASINMSDMYSWYECLSGTFKDCFDFKVQDENDIPHDLKHMLKGMTPPKGYLVQSVGKGCTACRKPYLCVTEPPPNNKPNPVIEDKQISAYVGKNGLGWNDELYTPRGNLNPWNIASRQCKWEKKDLGIWLNSLKKYYSDIYSKMHSDNSMPKNLSYFLSNPDHIVYLENEINIYVDGDTSSQNYKDDNQTFMDSIEGFFYIPTTCEQQLKVLDNISSYTKQKTYKTASQRCDGYFKHLKGDQRRDYETNKVNTAKDTVIRFTKWFNKKFKKNIHAYSADLDSNSFPNVKQLKAAHDNDVNYDNIFQELKL